MAVLLIVDALNLIRRIHAVQGSPCADTCVHALQQLIVHSNPTHAVAVFDDEARSTGWRHQLFPDYKAGRAPMPDDLHAEMPALRRAFIDHGVACWHSPGNEADDLAATLAVKVVWRRAAGLTRLLGTGWDQQLENFRRGGHRPEKRDSTDRRIWFAGKSVCEC